MVVVHLSNRIDLAVLDLELELWTHAFIIISWRDVPVVLVKSLTALPEFQKCSCCNTMPTTKYYKATSTHAVNQSTASVMHADNYYTRSTHDDHINT